jgi:hypothetical protein
MLHRKFSGGHAFSHPQQLKISHGKDDPRLPNIIAKERLDKFRKDMAAIFMLGSLLLEDASL